MANWYGTSRTNYFKVKDREAFNTWVSTLGGDLYVFEGEAGRVGLGANTADGSWPTSCFDDETNDYVDIDFVFELAEHLVENEVAIIMVSGAEKLRYITGYAVAIRSDGRELQINLDDIYELVNHKWGVEPTRAEY